MGCPQAERGGEATGSTRGCFGKKGTPGACNKNCGSSGPIPQPRLLAPGLRIPPWPASASSSASCASQGRGTMGACADPAPPGAPPLPPGDEGACAESPRPRGRETGPPTVDGGPALPPSSRGCRSRPVATYRVTAAASTSRWKRRLAGASRSLHAFQRQRIVTRSRSRIRGRSRATLFPFYEAQRPGPPPLLRVRRLSSVMCSAARWEM